MLLLNPLFCMTAINTCKAIYERELRFFGYYTTVYTLVNKVVRRSRKINNFKALYTIALFGLTSLSVLAEGNGAWW